ncbi:MAG: hypothetical protein HYX68_13935 [Planctomycetes bacterium]|nr:hypothetical protein [Planctomycetota bacterium]
MTQLLSTKDCIRLLQIPEHRLVYAYRTGKLPEPSFIIGGTRVFTKDDVRRVAVYFGIDLRKLDAQGETQNVRN